MHSLRRQLHLGTALGTTVVLVACGVALHALVSRTLRAGFDAALETKARSLTTLFETDEDALESDLTTAPLPEFAAAATEYYEVWLPDGSVFARSPSLGAGNLQRSTTDSDQPVFRTTDLPNGQRGRSVQVRFVPRQELHAGHASAKRSLTLVVAHSTAGLETTLAHVRGVLGGVGLGTLVVLSVVLAGVVHRALRPITRLSTQIAGIGERELDKRIDAQGIPVELVPVVERLNDLLTRLAAAFQRERRFTGDVAHELRTPLAGLRITLELALKRGRTPEEYRHTLGGALDVSLQMQRLVENLLQLARADAGQLEFRREPVDVVAVARECWATLQEYAATRDLRLEWNTCAATTVESDSDALRLILRNILHNAATYAVDGTTIRVAVTIEREHIVLRVSNDAALSAADAPRVFDRFWQADTARRRHPEAGAGLGLPLCQALVEQLGGSITAAVNAERVFTITVCLAGREPNA